MLLLPMKKKCYCMHRVTLLLIIRGSKYTIRGGIIYCSHDTSKAKATNDSCVQLTSGDFAFIEKIVLTEDRKLMCLVQTLRLSQDSLLPSIIIKCAYDVFGDISIIPFKDISRKCIFISFDHKHFVCTMPNLCERD